MVRLLSVMLACMLAACVSFAPKAPLHAPVRHEYELTLATVLGDPVPGVRVHCRITDHGIVAKDSTIVSDKYGATSIGVTAFPDSTGNLGTQFETSLAYETADSVYYPTVGTLRNYQTLSEFDIRGLDQPLTARRKIFLLRWQDVCAQGFLDSVSDSDRAGIKSLLDTLAVRLPGTDFSFHPNGFSVSRPTSSLTARFENATIYNTAHLSPSEIATVQFQQWSQIVLPTILTFAGRNSAVTTLRVTIDADEKDFRERSVAPTSEPWTYEFSIDAARKIPAEGSIPSELLGHIRAANSLGPVALDAR